MIATYPDLTVCNIDRDECALAISEKLCRGLGVGGMRFKCLDVKPSVDEGDEQNEENEEQHGEGKEGEWADFDVIFLAALVGSNTTEKLSILRGLKGLRSGALVVARSAWGVRGVLYPVRPLFFPLLVCF